MKYEILLNKLYRVPLSKAIDLINEYEKNIGFKTFAERQETMDVIIRKNNSNKQIKPEVFKNCAISLLLMSRGINELSKKALDDILYYPLFIWIEALAYVESNDIINIINNYYKELPRELLETLIINAKEEAQAELIKKCHKQIDISSELFSNFYYSLSDEGREELDELFPNAIGNNVLLKLQDVDEKDLITEMKANEIKLNEINADDLIEFILLKVTKPRIASGFCSI